MRQDVTRSALISLVIVLSMAGLARAQDAARQIQDLPTGETYRIEALGVYWTTHANVIVSSDAPGLPGTRIDFKRDLGLPDRGFPELQVTWRPGLRHKFRSPIHSHPFRLQRHALARAISSSMA